MSKLLYPKLALSNIKKNAKVYVPYILTCILTIGMYYIINSLAFSETTRTLRGGDYIQVLMALGTFVVALFAIIFLFYTNSFLMKRRKKEIGLYNILGMEKKHISIMIFFETLYVSLIHAFKDVRLRCGTIQNGKSFATIGTTDSVLILDFSNLKVSDTRTLSDDFFCHSSL